MSLQLIRILTQYEENVAFGEGGVAWKFKGPHEFTLRADADLFMYGENQCVEAIKQLLKQHDNASSRYTYVEHEIIFHEPTPLPAEQFKALFNQICKNS